MNAEPLLDKIAKSFATHRLEAVMVGNAAAALQGAPVTTLDIDFMFRKTPANLKKLKVVARSLGAIVWKQFYPRADRFWLANDDVGWRVTLLAVREPLPTVQLDLSGRAMLLAQETERALIDQIRRLQALPMNKRTHFLRVRHPRGSSHL